MRRTLLATMGALLLLPALASASDPQEVHRSRRNTTFAPAQGGPVRQAVDNSRFAPGRLLVQVDPLAKQQIDLQVQGRRSAGTLATGLVELDRMNERHGLRSLELSHPQVASSALAERAGARRWYTLELDPSLDMERVAQDYRTLPEVTAATPDYRAFPAVVPNDPRYDLQWGHNNTGQMKDYCWQCGGHDAGSPVGTPGFDANAQAAWDGSQGFGSSSVVIAIIDSGVDTGHADLTLVAGYDYGDNDSNPMDNSSQAGHGTACAGVAAAKANNGIGVAGIAGNCAVMPLKVANSAGSMFFSAIQNALYFAADNGADIASLSLGAAISSDPATDSALQYAYNAGVTILAATGNENASTISYPAINQYVIAVGAASPCGDRKRSSSNSSEVNPGVNTDPNGYTCDNERWWGSNYGTNSPGAASAVDIIAPTILPTTDISGSAGYNSGDYDNWFNGTSCATPYAAGVAALVKSKNPTWTPAQIRDQLRSTAQDVTSVESGSGWDRYTGYGMVDAAAAVGGGSPPPPPPGQDYATLPYNTGFESGSADQYWGFESTSASYGRIQVTSSYTPRGSYQLVMDVNTNGNYNTNRSDLHLDLSGESQVDLSFWWKEFGDETHSSDGVYFSDDGGNSFVKVQDLNGQSYSNNTWQQFDLDLDQLASSNGLSLSSTFVVRFQQYDNYAATTDGHAIDDISVTAGGSPPPPPPSGYATVPYSTGFESGAVDQYWETSSTGDGRVRVLSTNGPYAGSYMLAMDDASNGGYTTNTADLKLDLGGETQVDLSFRWKEFGDETHSQDGVYFSDNDGASFVKVQDLNGQSYSNNSWQFFELDVDQLASSNGLSLTSTFIVRFQQYDNYPIATDGHAIDEISVTEGGGGGGPSSITAESEPNGDSGSADGPVGTGVAVSGTISSSSDDDWYWFDVTSAGNINISVAIGSSADLDWFLYNSSLTEVARGYTVGNPEAGSYNASTGRYYLRVDGYNGATSGYTLTVSGGLATSSPGAPKADLAFRLGEATPNPFNPRTTLHFDLPQQLPVELAVYNVRGQRVRTLLAGELRAAGPHQVVWDGSDDGGQPAASGAYFYRLRAGEHEAVRRMLLMK